MQTEGFQYNLSRWRWQHKKELDGDRWSEAHVPFTFKIYQHIGF